MSSCPCCQLRKHVLLLKGRVPHITAFEAAWILGYPIEEVKKYIGSYPNKTEVIVEDNGR